MKIFATVIGFSVAVVSLAIFSTSVFAEGNRVSPLTDDEKAVLIESCTSVQSQLTRVHNNDALARVHLGQEYEILSSKLMTPMNSRVVLDKYDGADMIKTAADFSDNLKIFRSSYQTYDQDMSKLLKYSCKSDPDGFIDLLNQVRLERQRVRSYVEVLATLAVRYRDNVNDLKTSILGTLQDSNDAPLAPEGN